MKKKRKEDIEICVAAAIVMIYLIILTFAALDRRESLAAWATAVFVCLLYICKQADQAEKAELRHRRARARMLQQSLDELEAWREQREAD